MTPSVIPFWNCLTKRNHILKEKVKKFVMVKYFFLNFTSASAKSNLANVGGILARIKIFFLQRWFLIGSSIRFQAGVTFEEKLYIITKGYYNVVCRLCGKCQVVKGSESAAAPASAAEQRQWLSKRI